MTKEEFYRLDWMTDDQWKCYELIGDVFGGLNHVFGKVHPCGDDGIKINSTNNSNLATYDFRGLTTAVILAHERMIRFCIIPSGPGMLGLVAHKRKSRDGDVFHRHPSIEDAIKMVREEFRPDLEKKTT